MKTKITLLIAFVSLSLSSCVKDFIGHGPDGKEIEFTGDNYLDTAVLQKLYLGDEIIALDAQIDKLNQIPSDNPDYNEAQAQIGKLTKQRADHKTQIAGIVDASLVSDFPIPCTNFPNGKCIPVRLEFFIFNENITRAVVLYKDDNGNEKGISNKLVDVPNLEGKLQYIRVPVTDYDKQITLEIAHRDRDGNKTRFEITLNN
jgi:hypothetical protein